MSAIVDLLLTIVPFVLVLSVVVVVHELGHFWAGRSCGVAIEAFSVGWGKSLLELRDKHGVRWKLARWPIGGFVMFKGDENAASVPTHNAYEDPAVKEAARKAGILAAQPVGVRAWVSVAGPLANFVFSILVFAALFMAVGRDVTSYETLAPRIDKVQAGSPAEAAGLAAGDVVHSINGARIDNFQALQDTVFARPGEALSIVVMREGALVESAVTPCAQTIEGPEGSRTVGTLGIERVLRPEDRQIEKLGPLAALGAGAGQVWAVVEGTGDYLGKVLTGRASGDQLIGPLGIADVTGQVARGAVEADGPDGAAKLGMLLASLANLIAALSVGIGIANLLPVPLLDGGALVFYAIEAVRGRPLSDRVQRVGLQVGAVLVASLFLFATWNDLQRVFERFSAA